MRFVPGAQRSISLCKARVSWSRWLGCLDNLEHFVNGFIVVPRMAVAVSLKEPHNYGLLFRSHENSPDLAFRIYFSGWLSLVVLYHDIALQSNSVSRLQSTFVLLDWVFRDKLVMGFRLLHPNSQVSCRGPVLRWRPIQESPSPWPSPSVGRGEIGGEREKKSQTLACSAASRMAWATSRCALVPTRSAACLGSAGV